VERLNSEGIVRTDLAWALGQRRLVHTARRLNSCMLCKRSGVNEAGICDVCYAVVNEEELALAEKWMRGTGP
jgi:hypothetical protein